MSKNKKHTARLLLCLSTLQIFLPFIIFTSILVQKKFQNELITEHFNSPAFFEKIVLDEKEFASCQNNENEVVINNTFYDIGSIEKKNGKYIIYVLADKRESSLQKAFGENSNSVRGFNNKNLVFAFLYFENVLAEIKNHQISEYSYPDYQNSNLKSLPIRIVCPPPDLS